MKHEVAVRSVAARQLVVVRNRRKWSELGAKLIPLLDRVYVAVRAGQVIQTGHNVFVFRDGSKDSVTVEIGVEGTFAAAPPDGLLAVATPAGEVAATLFRGPYSGLGDAHRAVIDWCTLNGRARADVWWEIYGDWHEDPTQTETEVFYALAA
jgi:effector-binding domain-containing protein